MIWQTFAVANSITYAAIDDPSDCSITVQAPEDLTVCFDEEFSLNGLIFGDYDEFVWLEDGNETNYDLDEEVSVDGTTTFTLIASNINEENIIINGDFEDGDSDFTTDYTLGTVSCFGLGFLDCEGTYGVIDDPSDGHSSFAACSDAVGGGNMLVVNGAASLQQIWCQEVCVEPGTSYVFSSWAASVNPGSPAQLQFAIDGGLIGSLFSLTSTTCDWEEFEAEWTSSSETTIEICVTNQNTAASGNDFAIDGVQFVRVCEDEASFTVTHSDFEVQFNDPIEITCNETESEIAVTTLPLDDYTYEWETSNGNIIEFVDDGQSILVNQAGEYTVTITNPLGCDLDFEIEVEEDVRYPELEITSSNNLNCLTPTSDLDVDSDLNGITYTWFDQDLNLILEDDNITIDQGGLYYVTGYDPDTGCESMESIFIEEDFEELAFDIIASNNLDCNNTTSTLSVAIDFETIIWNDLTSNNTLGNFNTININSPGLYSAMLTFENGCESSDSVLITEVNPNFDYAIEYDSILDCNTTISDITLELDTVLYTFEWQNSAIEEISTFKYSSLQEGVYLFQITDSLNCTLLDSISITEDTTPPNVFLNTDSLSCTNNEASLSIDNPLDELTVDWTPANGTTITLDSITINNPSAVTYIVTGLNGCTTQGQYDVISTEDIPSIIIDGNTITCTNIISNLITSSNLTGLTYDWTLPNGTDNTENIETDIPGIYTLTVTTETGCQSNTSFEVLIDTIAPSFELPEDLILDCTNTTLTGTLSIQEPYQEIITSNSWLETNTLNYIIDEPGVYTLELINENGCSSEKSFEVDLDTLSPIISFENIQELDCNSMGFDLEIIIENEFETLSWNGDIIPNDQLIQNINTAGIYEAITISKNGCETRRSVTIESSDETPEFTVTSTLIDCNNPVSLIEIEITTDYSVLNIFNDNLLISNELIFETTTTPLKVEVIGNNGCTTSQIITLETDTTSLNFTLGAEDLTCNRIETLIEITSSENPTSISVVKIENGNTLDADLLVNNPGLYIIELENSNGCLSAQSIVIEEISDFPSINNFNTSTMVCESALIVSDFEIIGGSAPYQLTVDNLVIADFNDSFILQGAGIHNINVADTNGCAVDTTIFVDEIEAVTSFIIPELSINEGLDASLELILNKPLEEIDIIDWSPKQDLTCYDCLIPTFTGQNETTYTIFVRDLNGCEIEIETRINIEINVKYYIPNVFVIGDNPSNSAFTIYDNTEDILNIQFLNIYDRWGNLVFVNKNFSPNDPNMGWNGTYNNKTVEEGVYVYFAILELRNGEIVKESGDVTFLK